MKTFRAFVAGVIFAFVVAGIVGTVCGTETNYIDQAMYEDEEIERLILLDVSE